MENQFPSKTHQVAKLPSELVVGVLRTPDKNPFHFSHKDKIDELEVLAFDQKIKKIHKKKFKENYKNIELIQSVYDAPTNDNIHNNNTPGVFCAGSLREPEQNHHSTQGFASQNRCCNINNDFHDKSSCGCKKPNTDTESYYEKKKERTKQTVQYMKEQIYSLLSGHNNIDKTKLIEGYTTGDRTASATGNIDIDFDNKDPLYWLFTFPYQMFQYIPQLINALIYDYSYEFASAFTLEKDATTQEGDAQVIHDIIALTFSFPICIFITYNWFFLLAYKSKYNCQNTDPHVDMCRPANDSVRMKLNFDSIADENVKEFLNLFFDFSVKPLDLFDQIVFGDKGISRLCLMCPSRILIKFLLLLMSFLIITYFSLFESVESIVVGSSLVIMGFCIIVIIYQFGSQHIGYYIPKIIDKFKPSALTMIAVFFIFSAFRIILAIFSIATSSILISFYFWTTTMFAFIIYGEKGLGGIPTEIENIDSYMDEDILWLQDKDTNCFKPELWRKVLRTIVFFIYDNFYALSFLCIMSSNIVNMRNLQSPSLTYVIYSIIGVVLFLLGIVMFINSGKTNSRMIRVDGKLYIPANSAASLAKASAAAPPQTVSTSPSTTQKASTASSTTQTKASSNISNVLPIENSDGIFQLFGIIAAIASGGIFH